MKKKVIISCIPKLNDVQQNAMRQLLADLESLGYQGYLWAEHDYPEFEKYKLNTTFPKGNKWINKIKKVLFEPQLPVLDKFKWTQRLMRWLDFNDEIKAAKLYDNYIRQAHKIFSVYKPDLFFCWNPHCCLYGIAYDAAQAMDIKTAAIEWGYLPNTFLLDKDGTLAHSSIFNNNTLANCTPGELAAYQQKGEEIFHELQSQSLSLYNQAKVDIPQECLIEDPARPKILLLAIDEIDAGAYPANHNERKGLLPFHSSSIDQAKAIAQANPQYRVIFKPHPSHNLYPSNQEVSSNCWVVNGNPDQLIDWTDVVFCAGSKMEFSALLKNKPLITFGAGLLYGKNCSFEIKDPGSLNSVISSAVELGNAGKLTSFKVFLGYLYISYLYVLDSTGAGNNISKLKQVIN